MDDWPADQEAPEDDEWASPDDEADPEQDPFSAAVGEAWEWGRRGTIIDEML